MGRISSAPSVSIVPCNPRIARTPARPSPNASPAKRPRPPVDVGLLSDSHERPDESSTRRSRKEPSIWSRSAWMFCLAIAASMSLGTPSPEVRETLEQFKTPRALSPTVSTENVFTRIGEKNPREPGSRFSPIATVGARRPGRIRSHVLIVQREKAFSSIDSGQDTTASPSRPWSSRRRTLPASATDKPWPKPPVGPAHAAASGEVHHVEKPCRLRVRSLKGGMHE